MSSGLIFKERRFAGALPRAVLPDPFGVIPVFGYPGNAYALEDMGYLSYLSDMHVCHCVASTRLRSRMP